MTALLLTLAYARFDRVEFMLDAEDGTVLRHVVVRVGSAPRWRDAVVFPTDDSDATATTGDPTLDAEIRRRAAEWLVLLEAAVRAVREGRWIA